MRTYHSATALLIALALPSLVSFGYLRVLAKEPMPSSGWLEGSVQDETGRGISSVEVRILRNGLTVTETVSSYHEGGFYSFRNVKPGIYEVRAYGKLGTDLRAVRIWGVTLKPDARVKLNITMEAGRQREMQEIGQPTVETTPVIPLSQKLASLQAQIDQLKKQLGSR